MSHLHAQEQEAAEAAADGEDSFQVEDNSTPRVSLDGSILTEDQARELAKFASQKEHKRAMEASIELFNRCAFAPKSDGQNDQALDHHVQHSRSYCICFCQYDSPQVLGNAALSELSALTAICCKA